MFAYFWILFNRFCMCSNTLARSPGATQPRSHPVKRPPSLSLPLTVGRRSQAIFLERNSAMDDSIKRLLRRYRPQSAVNCSTL